MSPDQTRRRRGSHCNEVVKVDRNDDHRTNKLDCHYAVPWQATNGHEGHCHHPKGVCELVVNRVDIFTEYTEDPAQWLGVEDRHRTVEHVLKCFAEQIVRRQIRQHAHGRTHGEGKECLRKTKHRVDAFVNSVSSSKLFFLPVGQPNAIKGQAGQRDVAGAHVDMTCEPCLHEESVIS